MKTILLSVFAALSVNLSIAQPSGQPTGPSTYPYPADPNSWSMQDPWVIFTYLSLEKAVPGTADQPLLVWGMDSMLGAAGSLNSYLASYTPTSRTINGKPLSSNITLNKSDIGLSNVDNTSDLNKPVSTATQTALNGKLNNPTGTTAQYLRGDGSLATFPTSASRAFNNNVSRTLNSNYTISTTRDAQVSYSVSLSVTNPLLAGSSTASAFLEYSTDGGTNWITVSQAINQSSVTLSVTIAITLPNTQVLTGTIPANALVRVRSTTSGTASVTYTRGQEVLL